ncbi:tRNA-modifying protein YgfZ [Candidatus Profftia sp. (ex Adelges kitamiensis)]|uniref:tRNA-modifying protein YgfZ n=1 Tax=Candidatus Profftia sp. (ex Adelges kitamiensis) TaxID=2864218 RepID=UPI001CE32B11|nr:tRNA-modifying protein YgfZ [Candidatus Profftia sp. (ex Adelges kitamiensis)]
MSFNFFCTPRQPVASEDLPPTIMLLNDLQVINVIGPDARKYLQGQLTVDIMALTKQEHILCGHCNAKGKILCDLRLFYQSRYLSYIIRRSVANNQITELKKYAVFSNLTITTNHQVVILGVAGLNAANILIDLFFPQLPNIIVPVITQKETTIIYLAKPKDRYLLIMSIPIADKFLSVLKGHVILNDNKQWIELEIEAGHPIINHANSGKLIPQAINLQALGGICFHKGCYIGQEMIARAQYRGSNHRSLYWLKGTANHFPQENDYLEVKLGEKWHRTGNILASIRMEDGSISIQAILNKNLEDNSIIRVCNDQNSILNIQKLPYLLVK